MRIGVVGAGFIGQAVAQLGHRHGDAVMLSNSRGPATLATLACEIGCDAGSAHDACMFGDLVVVAVPLKNYQDVPVGPLVGKVVLDTMNYYPGRDGRIAELDSGTATTSELLARHLPRSRIVKAFNAILACDLKSDGCPSGSPERRAIPIAGDDPEAKALAVALLDDFGFDAVDAGPLAEGWRFERARPAYCVPLAKAALARVLAETTRESAVPEGSWRH